jgi:hypothetical protein
MWRSLDRKAMSRPVWFALALVTAVLAAAPSLAQAPGYVRVNLVKAGLILGSRTRVCPVDLARRSFDFDCVRCISIGLFLVRNWCGGRGALMAGSLCS